MPPILAKDFSVVEFINAEPICGEDFCDRCGDCLACYNSDPCYDGGDTGGSHTWVVYAEDAAAFKQRHQRRSSG